MRTLFSYDELKIVPYTESRDVSLFESRTEDLNAFLKEDALENQKELINKTFLCYHFNQLVGYILTFGELKYHVLLPSRNICRITNDNNAIEEQTFEKGGTRHTCVTSFGL